ncbi:MAG: hypothetical protein ACLGG4_09000, partial [Gammaproteobacteria bacterium]
VFVFASWAWHDAPSQGVPRYIAVLFTVAWFFIFVLAVFPYLYITRGLKAGTLASLKFFSLCVACGIVWLALAAIFNTQPG